MAHRLAKALRRLGAVVLLVITAATLGLFLWPYFSPDPDQRAIDMERMKRRFMHTALGWSLPGTPDLSDLNGRLSAHGLTLDAPILMRIFKREFELEVWKLRDGRFHRFATYPICRWSGRLGPKFAQGDRQAPEGFYTVDKSQLNPESRWHRSFNLGFPNVYDRHHRRHGSFLMVHGGCSSIGCFAITKDVVDELWTLVTKALDGGQRRFQVQSFPFRMTEENLAHYERDANAAFWRDLKGGNDLFEKSWLPPRAGVCKGRYVFEDAGPSPDGSGLVVERCPATATAG